MRWYERRTGLFRWAKVHRPFVLAVSGEPVICSARHKALDVKVWGEAQT